MANLSITVPDATVPRIREAFGRRNAQGVLVPATALELTDAIKAFIRSRVVDHETTLQAETARETLTAEVMQW